MGHPKRLLLVSEPKIQSHHEKGKLVTPVPSVSPRDSGSLLQVFIGREGEGNHRAPISPQQPRKEESTREEKGAWPLWPRTWSGTLGIRTVKLLASYPGVFISHPGQGVKYKARGKMKAELSVLGWLHPTACPSQHHSSAFLHWGVQSPRLEALWPASLLS